VWNREIPSSLPSRYANDFAKPRRFPQGDPERKHEVIITESGTMKSPFFMTRSAPIRWIAAAGFALGTLSATATQAPDLDADGVPNIVDPDIDNDGIPNALDDNIDGGIARSGPFTGQYLGDHINNDNPAEKDIDDDGMADDSLGETDIDADSKTDDQLSETDIDGDRRADDFPSELDIDGDGRNDNTLSEDDIDGDSLDDDDLMEDDIDGDSQSDLHDDDIDGDSLINSGDIDDDTDGDGINNADDSDDSDGDGLRNREDDDDDNDGETDEDDSDHHHEIDETEVHSDLSPTVNAPNGSRSRVVVQRMATGKVELSLDGRDIGPGAYEVIVDGQTIGTLLMVGDEEESEGEVEFETGKLSGDELLLPFDPIGLGIELRKDGLIYFTGVVPTPPDAPTGGEGEGGADDGQGGNSATVELDRAPSLGGEAQAEAQVHFGLAGAVEFGIEVEGIQEGLYQIAVDGVIRGNMTVGWAESKTVGSVRFLLAPEDPGDLPLDFEVAGKSVVILHGGTTLFSGIAPLNP
jgi:hypothetical protein